MPWGCLEKVAVSNPKKTQITSRIADCAFIIHAYNNNIYQFLVHKLNSCNIHLNTII